MAVRDAQNRMGDIWKELNEQWHTTCQYWHDAEQVKFENIYWNDLGQQVTQYLRALDSLDESLRAAEIILGN
ncbi:MAG TPA: hypothetical protein VFD70_27065 [Anaerolineae bacterium]|nr:hypothetical protein [Anaerolineae bacterium]